MRVHARIAALCILMAFLLAIPMIGPARAAGTMQTYIVLYGAQAVPADAARVISNAGGVLIYAYNAIGVVIARSDSPWFRDTLLADSRIEGVSSTARFGVRVRDVETTDAGGPPAGSLPNFPASDTDPLSGLQWDMVQISAPQAHAITGGSPAVVVGDIDTGLDKDHPDLVANIDFSRSVSCESGAPVQDPAAWDDHNGHGTHTAGTIAAAANGIGIVGVAPRVKIAGIKASLDSGFFFPEMVVCAFMWAATHQIDVTNNSYFADPWYFNCRNDAEQRAIWKAEQRAIRYALSQGVTVVSAETNEADDLAHPTQDVISPDFPPGSEETRTVHNDCVVIPVEIPGVIGVTADGNLQMKSFYSNYGVGVTQVAAPGGDSILQRTPQAPNGRVLSTLPPDSALWAAVLPSRRILDCSVSPCAGFAYLQGTSMASPHVAGVAALVISQFGKDLPKGHLRPGQVAAIITQTADPLACPSAAQLALYAPFPSTSNGAPQTCQGGAGYNSWYGHGQVNALNAVQHAPGR